MKLVYFIAIILFFSTEFIYENSFLGNYIEIREMPSMNLEKINISSYT